MKSVKRVFWERNIEILFPQENHGDPISLYFRTLELIHSDLCTVEVPSNGNCRYFITFIDDFSIKAWVSFLKQKSDACDAFQKLKAVVSFFRIGSKRHMNMKYYKELGRP